VNTKQAKDFLVELTSEQAALEGTPLSDVEKRMMYFTESDPSSCENPTGLNDEFEEKYETNEYESKISRLLHRAHNRLKKENPQASRNWDRAVRTLRKGDHYILVMVGQSTDYGFGWWMPLFWGIGIGAVLAILTIGKVELDARRLIPSWMFGWVSDNPATQKLEFEFILVGCVGVWFFVKLAKLGAFGDATRTVIRGLLSPFSVSRSKGRSRK
jgi:hypothetical protein